MVATGLLRPMLPQVCCDNLRHIVPLRQDLGNSAPTLEEPNHCILFKPTVLCIWQARTPTPSTAYQHRCAFRGCMWGATAHLSEVNVMGECNQDTPRLAGARIRRGLCTLPASAPRLCIAGWSRRSEPVMTIPAARAPPEMTDERGGTGLAWLHGMAAGGVRDRRRVALRQGTLHRLPSWKEWLSATS